MDWVDLEVPPLFFFFIDFVQRRWAPVDTPCCLCFRMMVFCQSHDGVTICNAERSVKNTKFIPYTISSHNHPDCPWYLWTFLSYKSCVHPEIHILYCTPQSPGSSQPGNRRKCLQYKIRPHHTAFNSIFRPETAFSDHATDAAVTLKNERLGTPTGHSRPI